MKRSFFRAVFVLIGLTGGCITPSLKSDAGTSPDGGDAGSGVDAGVTDAGPAALVGSLVIVGDLAEGLGIFDPSVVYPKGSDAGYLAYSVVPDQTRVHTRLSTSTDQGQTWSFIGEVNAAPDASVDTTDLTVCGQSVCAGTLIQEVPSLIVDPLDTPDRRFKVFTHTYFTTSATALYRNIGYLSLETAPAPEGPWTQTPLLGWNGSSTFSSQGVVQNITTDATLDGLAHCAALTEPGALLRPSGTADVIDLTVGCVFASGGTPQIEIDLLRSVDHAHSFTFVATLLSSSDAIALGSAAAAINAPDLFQIDGQTYLSATVGGPVQFPGGGEGDGYRGCVTLPLADLDAGTLVRDAGAPFVVNAYRGLPLQFVGACTAAEGAPGLGVAGDILAMTPPFFGIFATRRPAP